MRTATAEKQHIRSLILSNRLAAAQQPTVVFFNGLGDHLLTLPALRALTHVFPDRLKLACVPYALPLFFANLPVKSTCDVNLTSVVGEDVLFDADDLAHRIGKCDVLIYLNRALSDSALRLLKLVAPDASIGFFPNFTDPIEFPSNIHSADLAFAAPRLLQPWLKIDSFCEPLELPPDSIEIAVSLRSQLPPEARLLVLHTETLTEKMWSLARFQRVLQEFQQRHPEFWIFVIDRRQPNLSVDRMVSCCGLPLATAFAIVSQADYFLGIDSCFLHAADMFGVPGVGLFGPTSPKEFGFRFSKGISLRYGNTMDTLTEGPVLEALTALIGAKKKGRLSP